MSRFDEDFDLHTSATWTAKPGDKLEQFEAMRISVEQWKQNPSLIPFNPGWFIGIPLLDYEIILNILGSIIHYNHQPTGFLNTAQFETLWIQVPA